MQSINSCTFKLQACYYIDYRENSLYFTCTGQFWRQRKKKQKIKKIFRKCPTNQDKPFFLRKKLEKKKFEMQAIEPHTFKLHVHYSTFELHFL